MMLNAQCFAWTWEQDLITVLKLGIFLYFRVEQTTDCLALELDLREQDFDRYGMLCPRSTVSKVTVRRRETKLDIGMTDFALKLETGI